LGKIRQAAGAIEELLEDAPEDARVLEAAAYFYLARGKRNKAAPLVAKLEEIHGATLPVLELRAELFRGDRKWQEARNTYELLLDKDPENRRFRGSYAEVLLEMKDWQKARALYEQLAQEKKDKTVLQNLRRSIEEGAFKLENDFQYFRSGTEQDYKLGQGMRFWLSPRVRIRAGATEEFYKKGAAGEVEATDRHLIGHIFDASYFGPSNFTSIAKWRATYYNNEAFHELSMREQVKVGPFSSEIEYDWNYLARDPVEAIDKKGLIDKFRMRNSWTFGERLESGHELGLEWFRLDGKRNSLTGSDHLGHKITNTAFVNLVIVNVPYFAINYQYTDAHWNMKFYAADEVIGYLADEQVHAGGLYAEYQLLPNLEVTASVTRGSDRKRRVDYVNWVAGGSLWAGQHMQLVLTFEYDVGDSGTSGGANSQIITAHVNVYF